MSVVLKPIPKSEKSHLENTKDRLWKGEYICSTESSQIRKDVFVIKKYYPIERMNCDCLSTDRKHFCYYLEWALLER